MLCPLIQTHMSALGQQLDGAVGKYTRESVTAASDESSVGQHGYAVNLTSMG